MAKQKVIQAELEEKLVETEGNLTAARTKSNVSISPSQQKCQKSEEINWAWLWPKGKGEVWSEKHLSTVIWFPHSSKAGSKKAHFHTKLFAVWPKLNLSLFQDLRSKNRKAMEALNEMEQKYVKLLKTQQAA